VKPGQSPPARAPEAPRAAHEVFGDRLGTAIAYADLLATAGVDRGLIGPREVDRLWERHLLNSAAISDAIPTGSAVLDVGSGAGLPGIPLSLSRPDLHVTLVEPLLRRTVFLTEVCDQLDLYDVDVRRSRAENMPRAQSDVVVARAVAPLARLLPWTMPLLRPGGRLVAMKGRSADQELADALPVLRRLRAREWEVRTLAATPGVEATRAVLVVAG
jgi:16S rRNA (guanine527-N7)-methyltransferase